MPNVFLRAPPYHARSATGGSLSCRRVPFRSSSHTGTTSTNKRSAYIAKHHPIPAASARGCITAIAAPAVKHRIKLQAAWAVADLCLLRSVRRVAVICKDERRQLYNSYLSLFHV